MTDQEMKDCLRFLLWLWDKEGREGVEKFLSAFNMDRESMVVLTKELTEIAPK